MHVEEEVAMRILTEARRAIDANHREVNELPDSERERRVAVYATKSRPAGASRRGCLRQNLVRCTARGSPTAPALSNNRSPRRPQP